MKKTSISILVSLIMVLSLATPVFAWDGVDITRATIMPARLTGSEVIYWQNTQVFRRGSNPPYGCIEGTIRSDIKNHNVNQTGYVIEVDCYIPKSSLNIYYKDDYNKIYSYDWLSVETFEDGKSCVTNLIYIPKFDNYYYGEVCYTAYNGQEFSSYIRLN